MKSKSIARILAAFLLLTPALSGGAEESPGFSAGSVSRGTVRVSFRYPEECAVADEGDIGTCIYLTENEYVALMIPKAEQSGTAWVRGAIGDSGEITALSEHMNVFAVHGDANHRMSRLDVVEVGLDLPDGTGLVACAYAPYGSTGIYELLLTVLDSVTDTAALEEWLGTVWIPGLA